MLTMKCCNNCERYDSINHKFRNKLYCFYFCKEYQENQWKDLIEYLGVNLDEQTNKKETN